MSRLSLGYTRRECWDKTNILGKENKRVVYLSDWPHLPCSCCYEKHSSHQVFSGDYPQREESGSHSAKSHSIHQALKQPFLRPVGLHILGMPWWWEGGWRGGEEREIYTRNCFFFLIENPLSWKHGRNMPLVLMLTFLVTKEACCLQTGICKYKHCRQTAEAVLCEQPAARAAAAGNDAQRALECVALSFYSMCPFGFVIAS